MSHLFGTILKPSLTENFTDWWTSSLQDTLANRSLPQASEQERKTQDTCGLGSQTEFGFSDQESASSRMSKDISRWDSPASSATWKSWVTRCRGEYSQRVKLAHRTSASGSSSWPTIRASEYKDTGPIGSKSHDHMLGKGYLCAVVTQDAANWLTPATVQIQRTDMQKRIDYRASIGRKYVPGSLEEQMQQHGLPAPANPSTDGSRPELLDQSQRNWQTFAHGTHNRGETPHRQVVRALVHGAKAQTQCLTVDQVFAEEILGTNPKQESWTTITAHTPDMESSGPNGNSETYLAGAVKAEENWVTPRTSGTSTRPNKTTPRQGLTLIEQAREQEKMWRTPSVAEEKNQNTSTQIYLQNQVGATPKAWATPQASDHVEGRRTDLDSNQKCLGRDMKQWATATVSTGAHRQKDGSMTPMVERTQTGKLNPRWVETLMGLPVGWVMPSCMSPVTIELTNCDCLGTESSQPPQSEHLEH